MKNTILFALLGLGLFATSCSTEYKSDQTPDDVYFSPGRNGLTKREEAKDLAQREQYEEYINSADDRYLRMKVANNYRWSSLDDFDYWNDSRYDFGYYNYYNPIGFGWNNYYGYNYWNYSLGFGNYYPGWGWNYPTHTIITYYNPKSTTGLTSASAISAYKNKNYNNTNYNSYYSNSKAGYSNSNSSNRNTSNFSNLVRKVFSNSGGSNYSSSSWDRPARTFDNNTSSGRSYTTSSSAGGNSGGVSSTGSSSSTPRATRN